MGAFFLGLDRSGRAIDAALAQRAMASLRGFAPFGFATQHFDGGLLVVARDRQSEGFEIIGRDCVVIDGALSAHCRQQLQSEIAGFSASDARLIHTAITRWGEHAGAHLQGRFAIAMVDRQRDVLWLMRDTLGERALHLRTNGDRQYVATRASALLRAANLSMAENPASIAAYFALRAPASGEGFWQGVQAVKAGECLCISRRQQRSRREAFALSVRPLRFASDQAAVSAWRDVLSAACARALADAKQPGLLLSGGIDSSALAVNGVGLRPELIACSWSLPEFPSADESAHVAATVVQLGLPLMAIKGGEDWPLARLDQWSVEDEAPLANPYRWLHQALYARAAGCGVDVMLSGNFGDHLYADVRPNSDWRTGLRDNVRRILQPMPRLLAGLRRLLGRYPAPPDWLLEVWRAPLNGVYQDVPHCLLTAEAELDAELGRRSSVSFGIDIRFPYRDPEVIRFMAALPAEYSRRNEIGKWITREMLRGQLPESVRQRPKAGSLEAYFRHGVLGLARAQVASLLRDPEAQWPRYVKAERLYAALAAPTSESELLLLWLAISYELWWRAHLGLGPAVLASSQPQPEVIEQNS